MPAQHGQTYEPNEEPTPRGGWFGFVERPFPERLDRAFCVLAIVLAAISGVVLIYLVLAYSTRPPSDLAGYGWLAVGSMIAAGMAYGLVRGIGMVAVGIYGTARDGPEFVVDWRALNHDMRLRRTWIVLLEGALLLAAGGISVWGLVLLIREGSLFGLAVCLVVQLMTYWPMLRRRIAGGRTAG